MTIKNLDHLVITTGDLDRCLVFYRDLLGMEHVVQNGQHALHFGSQKFNLHTQKAEFYPAAQNPDFGTQDFCLIVDGDILSVKAEIEAAGYPILFGVVERAGALGPMDSIYLYDPDGNLVELAVYRT